MPQEIVTVPGHDRCRSLGWIGVAWIEWWLVHARGDIQGRAMHPDRGDDFIPLSDELSLLTVDAYALDANGRRLYDRTFYSRAKGADKSGQNYRFACFEALGPCRFAGWAKGGEVFEQMDFRYEYAPGEPMGKVVTYPFLRIMATEEGQAGNVYDGIYFNLTEGPCQQFFRRKEDVGLTRVFLPDGGEIRPCTAASASKDGGKETFASFDETHLYYTPPLKAMYNTVLRNLRKRKDAEGWASEVSTMYQPGRQSVAEASHDQSKMIAAGLARRPRFYFNHRQAPDATDIENEDSLRAGLKDAYGDAGSYIDIEGLIAHIWDPTVDRAESAQFFLNQATSASGSAFSIANWKNCWSSAQPPAERTLITLGFDGSLTEDSTALVGTVIETGYQWMVGLWEKTEDDGDDWHVPEPEVDERVIMAFTTWKVWLMYGDPSYWQSWMATWAGRYGDKKVMAHPTYLYKRMALAFKAYATAMATGALSHGGPQDDRFTAHIGNSYRKLQAFRDEDDSPLWLITKERKDSPRKVDAAYAGCLSWQARLEAIAAGANVKKSSSGYYIPDDDEDEETPGRA